LKWKIVKIIIKLRKHLMMKNSRIAKMISKTQLINKTNSKLIIPMHNHLNK